MSEPFRIVKLSEVSAEYKEDFERTDEGLELHYYKSGFPNNKYPESYGVFIVMYDHNGKIVSEEGTDSITDNVLYIEDLINFLASQGATPANLCDVIEDYPYPPKITA
ncbi:MAG: DUF6514 family protein [Defluviitaleaceae bacterium]|nr:DUF6514 family protein [Defluviitaleaceae bacterium]